MISKKCMEDHNEIESVVGTLRTLQDEIKIIKESINDEIEGAIDPAADGIEWAKGYISAMKTVQGLLGVSKN